MSKRWLWLRRTQRSSEHARWRDERLDRASLNPGSCRCGLVYAAMAARAVPPSDARALRRRICHAWICAVARRILNGCDGRRRCDRYPFCNFGDLWLGMAGLARKQSAIAGRLSKAAAAMASRDVRRRCGFCGGARVARPLSGPRPSALGRRPGHRREPTVVPNAGRAANR